MVLSNQLQQRLVEAVLVGGAADIPATKLGVERGDKEKPLQVKQGASGHLPKYKDREAEQAKTPPGLSPRLKNTLCP